MKNQTTTEDPKKGEVTIQENYEDSYWLETYGVTAEELKKTATNIGIEDKIIKANFGEKAFA